MNKFENPIGRSTSSNLKALAIAGAFKFHNHVTQFTAITKLPVFLVLQK